MRALQAIDDKEKAHRTFIRTRSRRAKTRWIELQKRSSALLDKDQFAHLNNQLQDLEMAALKREYGNLWRIIGYLTGPPKKPSRVKKLDGSVPSSQKEKDNEWRTYFRNLLNNRSAFASTVNHPPPSADNPDIPTTAITRLGVEVAAEALKRNRAAGPDNAMTAEVIRDGGTFIIDQLYKICQIVFENCQAPPLWVTSLIIPLPNKGNLELMTNWRGISLISIAAKLYNRILLNRIQKPIDNLLRKNQAGFRRGRSCSQQIHILRRIIEAANLDALPLYITFIDFTKAFDSLDREMMFAILRHYGIPQKIVDAIRALYDKSKSRVYVDGKLSDPFDITTGVLQGDVLASFLFIIVIDYISKNSVADFGYLTHKGSDNEHKSFYSFRTSTKRPVERRLNDLAFADDIALCESTYLYHRTS